MEMIVRDVGCAVIADFSTDAGKTVPDRQTPSVFIDRPLDLIG
jgi:hypothetical protein